MSRFSKHVSVVANPWFALDHKGRPCGVVPVEPRAVGGHLGFVGAKVDRSKTRGATKRPGEVVPSAQDTVYEFSAKPVKVGATPYYREFLRSGALLPGDAATAHWAGIRKFVEPAKALEQAKAKAETEFDRNYGEGALADLRAMHSKVEPAASDAAATKLAVTLGGQPLSTLTSVDVDSSAPPSGETGFADTAQASSSKRGKASNSQKDGE